MPRQLPRDEYTVGWVCALPVELAAACVMLDEEHEDLEPNIGDNDEYLYTLGAIAGHNVVIGCLPAGRIGTNDAAAVAMQMKAVFKGIRFGLMVGIGGGVPSEAVDIRLGDVVVSKPDETFGGVVQYDLGKETVDGFERKGSLNSPPRILLGAVSRVQADNFRGKSKVSEHIAKYDDLSEFQPAQERPDILFEADYDHEGGDTCDGCKEDRRKVRQARKSGDNIKVHYGTIASGNRVMKSAKERDMISDRLGGILCFEMEAAGLMNNYPCLVIRGICDYADSHKNKDWQPYAAGTAAAYARVLLGKIPPNRVKAEKKVGEVLSELQKSAEVQLDISRKQLAIQQEAISKEAKCLHLFRLPKSATYEWYKDRIENRVEGTCSWFVEHNNFQSWLKQEFGPLLVSADPGCGKSVLAKYLIDHVLPSQSATICYFFFQDHDQNTVRQALCALLHQLFSQKPSLIQRALEQYLKDGDHLIESNSSLWNILRDSIQDTQAGPVIIVLDALDECAESEFKDLMRNIDQQFRSDQSGYGKLKYVLTSRPYEHILCRFRGLSDVFPHIHIPGEDKVESISHEVNYVIKDRVERLARERQLTNEVKECLETRMLEVQHRTYLWVHLVFDYLATEGFKKTKKGVASAIKTLPESVKLAYNRILSKSKDPPAVRKALNIILAAAQPLTISEMHIAMSVDGDSLSIYDLDLEEENDFLSRFRSWCGLLVSIHHNKIYFLHQTAREFLLADPLLHTANSIELSWHRSFNMDCAHKVLAELCLRYLEFFNCGIEEAGQPTGSNALLCYAAKYWSHHFCEAGTDNTDGTIAGLALMISDPNSKAYSAWSPYARIPELSTSLALASYNGHDTVVKLLLASRNVDVNFKEQCGMTPLLWAAQNGKEGVVKLLLETGKADIDSKDQDGVTPLLWAAQNGNEGIAKMLLDTGKVDVDSKDLCGWTPLSRAAQNGHERVVKLLLDTNKADVNSKDQYGVTPLLWAAQNGNEGAVKLLLDIGKADVDSKDQDGVTPLSWAAQNGNEEVVKLLLNTGKADVNSHNRDGWTPLLWAAQYGHELVVKLLLDTNEADVNSKEQDGWTPLLLAAESGHEMVVGLLLDTGKVDVDLKNRHGLTPLYWAARHGHEVVVKLLLDTGKVDVNSKDRYGSTPLIWAARHGHEVVIMLLLDTGKVDVNLKNRYGSTPLYWAARHGHDAVVMLLLDTGKVDVDLNDWDGRTPLLWAAQNGHDAVVKLLLDTGKVDIDSRDRDGQTPLLWAAQNGHDAVVKLLLDTGKADANSRNWDGRTPLLWAAQNGHEVVVKLLLDTGKVDVDSTDWSRRTPLIWAAQNGHNAVVQLLLDTGKVDVNSRDWSGSTPLLWASQNEHRAVVELLEVYISSSQYLS